MASGQSVCVDGQRPPVLPRQHEPGHRVSPGPLDSSYQATVSSENMSQPVCDCSSEPWGSEKFSRLSFEASEWMFL